MAIDEKKLIKDLLTWYSGKKQYCLNHGYYDLLNDFEDCFDAFEDIIKEQPTIEAEPVRHAQWEHLAYNKFRCTACEVESFVETVVGCPSYSYCPNCGAKMDGKAND